jgi:ribosome-binding factor A
MRVLPELQFVYDKGVDAADRVAQLLEEVKPREGEGQN